MLTLKILLFSAQTGYLRKSSPLGNKCNQFLLNWSNQIGIQLNCIKIISEYKYLDGGIELQRLYLFWTFVRLKMSWKKYQNNSDKIMVMRNNNLRNSSLTLLLANFMLRCNCLFQNYSKYCPTFDIFKLTCEITTNCYKWRN